MTTDRQYVVYFDLASSGYGGWVGAGIGLILIAIGVLCIVYRRKLDEFGLFPATSIRLYAFLALAAVWTCYALWSGYSNYFSLLNAERSGKAKITEGPVRDFRPQTSEVRGFVPERFCVKDSCFEYSTMSSDNQFHRSRIAGGPIREGLQVRVTSHDGRIVKLEIAE